MLGYFEVFGEPLKLDFRTRRDIDYYLSYYTEFLFTNNLDYVTTLRKLVGKHSSYYDTEILILSEIASWSNSELIIINNKDLNPDEDEDDYFISDIIFNGKPSS